MKTTKLFSRFMTLFILMLLGFALGAKSAGLETSQFVMLMGVIVIISFLHFRIMRKKFA
jgi:hypothetical protein